MVRKIKEFIARGRKYPVDEVNEFIAKLQNYQVIDIVFHDWRIFVHYEI